MYYATQIDDPYPCLFFHRSQATAPDLTAY